MDKAKTENLSYRYVIAAACFGIQAICVGMYTSYGVFINPLNSEFGWSRATISGASSVAFFFWGMLGMFVGRLNDRIGPRKVMTVTSFFLGLGLLLMSRLDTVWQLYMFYGVVFGIGLSSTDVIALSTTVRWFVKKRGMMTGIVKVGTGAGQLVIPFAASVLIKNLGWRTSSTIIGVAGFLLIVTIAQLLRRDPGQMGLVPDDEKKMSRDAPGLVSGGLSFHEALRTKQLWIFCAATWAIMFCLATIMVHIVPYGQDIGVSAVRAASVLSTIGGVSMLGRLITGITIDRIGCKRVMIGGFFLLVAVLLWLQTAKELWMLYVFAAVYGITHGAFQTTFPLFVAELFGTTAHGVLFGIVAFSGTFSGAVGPVVAGYIFDITGGYSLALWLCTFFSVVGFVLVLFLKPIEKRTKIFG